METRRSTRRHFLKGLASLSALGCMSFLGMKGWPEVAHKRSGARFITEAKDGWHYMWWGETLYGAHPDHPPEKTYQAPDGGWVTEPVQFLDVDEQIEGWSLEPSGILHYDGLLAHGGTYFISTTRGQG